MKETFLSIPQLQSIKTNALFINTIKSNISFIRYIVPYNLQYCNFLKWKVLFYIDIDIKCTSILPI
jgi:hypothetical protein